MQTGDAHGAFNEPTDQAREDKGILASEAILRGYKAAGSEALRAAQSDEALITMLIAGLLLVCRRYCRDGVRLETGRQPVLDVDLT